MKLPSKINQLNQSTVPLKWVLAAFLLFVISLALVQVQVERQRDDFRRSVNAQLIEGDYQGRLHAYDDLQVEYRLCIKDGNDRLAEIAQWESFYDELEIIFNDIPKAVLVIRDLSGRLESNLPPPDMSLCVQPTRPERAK